MNISVWTQSQSPLNKNVLFSKLPLKLKYQILIEPYTLIQLYYHKKIA